MDNSTRTIVLSGLGIALVAGLAFVSFRQTPIPVDLTEATRDVLEITVNADGRTQVRDLFEVASPIAGTALRSPVKIGDVVRAGETVVAVVQPASSGLLDVRTRRQGEAALQESLAARHVAQADLQQAQETLNFAQTQFDRTKVLLTRGVASVTRLEDDSQRLSVAKATVEAAQARIEMADGTIERARASLLVASDTDATSASCCLELTSPTNGVVLSVSAMSKRPVVVGTSLVSIGDAQDLELVVDILSNDAVRLQVGALAYVERWGGTAVLQAKLDRIDPKAYTKISSLGIEEQRVDAFFSLINETDKRSGLGDGFAVFLRIVEWRAEEVLQVPLSAVFRADDDWAVFVAENGRAYLRTVKLGRRNERVTEVQTGLKPGEMVITHPSDAVADGVKLAERTQL